jgi:hypothetical protein
MEIGPILNLTGNRPSNAHLIQSAGVPSGLSMMAGLRIMASPRMKADSVHSKTE